MATEGDSALTAALDSIAGGDHGGAAKALTQKASKIRPMKDETRRLGTAFPNWD
jgi:citrate synthase